MGATARLWTAKGAQLTLLILSACLVHHHLGAQMFNCPSTQIKFEKIIGLRPSRLHHNSRLYVGSVGVPITLECIQRCEVQSSCASFILYYNVSECYSYSERAPAIQSFDYESTPDTNLAWFRKTCGVGPFCEKAWTFETVAGADFIGYDTKYVGNVTREECMGRCSSERGFLCRSIKFFVSDNNNLNSMGPCTLSEMDRHLIPNSFRVARYENEYIENQCSNSSFLEYCTYEEYDNATLKHADLLLKTLNEDECRQNCDTLPSFNCRGYTIQAKGKQVYREESTRCILHAEDSKLVGPKLLTSFPGGKYFEKARCLNVTAICTDKLMTITYAPEQPFFGRIYADGYSDTLPCYADGNYRANVVLELPLGKNMCGITETASTLPDRPLRSVLLVIQYNALIQTHVDRYVKVGCAFGNGYKEITLDTNINFTNAHPSSGSTIINNSSVLPIVTIRVVDYDTKQPTKDTQIGQELQLVIEIKPSNGPYDLWAGHLVASSDRGHDSILLLDDRGCPTQPQIFPAFSKVVTAESRMLVSTFQAFKFTSSQVVRFSVMVHFCPLICPPVECPNNRPKRDSDSDHLTTNATVVPIINNNDTIAEVMPLDVFLIVRGSQAQSDQLVIGKDNRILIAGPEWFTNQVCVDYALFVGLAVCWILLQIIILVCCVLLIRKYKKYFDIAYTRHLDEQHFSDTHQSFGLGGENLSRRVRWADQ